MHHTEDTHYPTSYFAGRSFLDLSHRNFRNVIFAWNEKDKMDFEYSMRILNAQKLPAPSCRVAGPKADASPF